MKIRTWHRTACINVLAVANIVFALQVKAADIAIVHAKIFVSPFEKRLNNGTVVIHDGKIASVGPTAKTKVPDGSTIVDGRGHVVTAGYCNSHVHLFNHALLHAGQQPSKALSKTLNQMFNRWGFTTVFDVGSLLKNTNSIQTKIRQGKVQGPNILTVGEPFYPPGGTPIYVRKFLKQEHLALPEVKTIRDTLDREQHQFEAGAQGVKLFTGTIVGGNIGVLPMSLQLAKALVDKAHHDGKLAFSHPSNEAGVETSINSHVDIIAHTAPMMGYWSASLVQRMLAQRIALIPTLTLFEIEAKRFRESDQDKVKTISTAQQQLHAYWAAGGDILFGTDIGYTDVSDTTEEYRLMAKAGMDYRAILATLTTTPSRRFGYATRKSQVAVGMDADLVVLFHNPASDPTAFADVLETIRGGQVISTASGQRH